MDADRSAPANGVFPWETACSALLSMFGSRPLLHTLLAVTALTPALLAAPTTGSARTPAMLRAIDVRAVAGSSIAPAASLVSPTGPGLSTDANCYDETTAAGQPTPVTVTGTGFPGARQIQLRAGSALSLGFPVPDAAGSFSYATTAPPVTAVSPPPPLVAAFELSTVDPASGSTLLVSPKPLRVATLSLAISPLRARPGQRVNFRATGVLRSGRPGRVLWAHYLFAGRVRRTVVIGRLAGPCGTLAVRRRLLPTVTRRGLWTVQFDLSRDYADTAVPRIIDTLRIS